MVVGKDGSVISLIIFAPSIRATNTKLVAFVVHETMEETKGFYKTTAWKRCRAAYIKSVGGLCERCLKDGLIVPGYIVHHKCYLTPENITNPNVTLNWDNLEYLCLDCHNKEHMARQRRYTITTDGKVIV